MHAYLIFIPTNHFIKKYYISSMTFHSWKKYKIYYSTNIYYFVNIIYTSYRKIQVLFKLSSRHSFHVDPTSWNSQKLKYLSINYRLVLPIRISFSFDQNSFSIYLIVSQSMFWYTSKFITSASELVKSDRATSEIMIES